MIRPALLLFALLAINSAYTPVNNFSADSIVGKTLYLNSILSQNELNLTVSKTRPYCGAFQFSQAKDGSVIAEFMFFTNNVNYFTSWKKSGDNPAQAKSNGDLSKGQWQSLGTQDSLSKLTVVSVDDQNSTFGIALSGNNGDLIVILTEDYSYNADILSMAADTAVNNGMNTPFYGYDFLACEGYYLENSLLGGGSANPFGAEEGNEEAFEEALEEALEEAEEAAEEADQEAEEAAEEADQKVEEAAEEAAQKVEEATEEAAQNVEEAVEEAAQNVQEADEEAANNDQAAAEEASNADQNAGQ